MEKFQSINFNELGSLKCNSVVATGLLLHETDAKSLTKDMEELNQDLKETSRKFKCVICHKQCEGFGNNPNPIASHGRCCDRCNQEVIIERYRLIIENQFRLEKLTNL